MVDMRKRFRGNAPISKTKELDVAPGETGGQLYAGKPAFRSTVRPTSGDEKSDAS